MKFKLEDFFKSNPVETHSIANEFQFDDNIEKDIQEKIINLIISTNKSNTDEWALATNWLTLICINTVAANKIRIVTQNEHIRILPFKEEIAKSFVDDLNKNIKACGLSVAISLKNVNNEIIEFYLEFKRDILIIKSDEVKEPC